MRFKVISIFALGAALFLTACGGKSDSDLQKAASDKLAADNVSGVTVAVKDGVATLTGEVADVTVRNKAEAAVKGVDGIKSVTNDLKMKPLPSPTPPPADPMLQGKVDEALKKAGCTGATASISNGQVTVTGTVPAAKYTECIQAVNEQGAGKIVNQLQKGK